MNMKYSVLNRMLNVSILSLLFVFGIIYLILQQDDIMSNLWCCLGLFIISYAVILMLYQFYETIRSCEDHHVSRGECLMIKDITDGGSINGCEVDQLSIGFYRNSVIFLDKDNDLLFEAFYRRTDIVADILGDCLDIRFNRGDITDHIIIYSAPLELQVIYDGLVHFGANFDDSWIYFSLV